MEYYTISKEKLMLAVKGKGMTMKQASVAINRSQSYLSQCCFNGRIAIYDSDRLLDKLEIDPHTYVTGTQSTNYEMPSSNEWYKTIYKAVYNAVKKAWSE